MSKMRSTDQIGKVVEWIDGATVHRSTDVQEVEDATVGFAWSLYNLDLNLLTNLIPIVSRDIPKISRKDVKVLKRSLGNLFLWGDGFRDGKLESVLGESDDLKETLVSSLVRIGRLLISNIAVTVKSTSTGEGVKDLVRELRILLEKARILRENDLDSEGVSDGDNMDLEGHEDRERLSMSISSLATYTTCLMDLLPSMEDTLNFASQAKDGDESSHPLDFHVSGPARSYILNIFDRFSKANPQLVERLGEANWQRHIALRNGLTKEADSVHVVIEEAPKSVFVPVSLFQDSGLGTSLHAHTIYAATSASHTSFVSSQADEEGGGLRVPPMPKAVSKGIPFGCEICGHTLSEIKNRIDWKRHVFADLKPYICTFAQCKDALRTFPTRKMWETHEFDHHRFDIVICCSVCSSNFPTEEEIQIHTQAEHGTLLEKKKVLGISPGWYEQRKPHDATSLSCPLCLCIPGKSRRNFITHVGKHMESIALTALPRENGSDSEPDSDLELSVDEQILDGGDFAAPNGDVAGPSLLQANRTTKKFGSMSSTSSLFSKHERILDDPDFAVPPPDLIAKIGRLERHGLNLGGAPPISTSPAIALSPSTKNNAAANHRQSATSILESDDELEGPPDLFQKSTLGMFEPGGEENSSADSDDDDEEEMYEGEYDDVPEDVTLISDEDEEIEGTGPIKGLSGDHETNVEAVIEDKEDEDEADLDSGDEPTTPKPAPNQTPNRKTEAYRPPEKNPAQRQSSRTSRSMPSSPNLADIGSPSLGPNFVPLSQQNADRAKTARKPIVHLLALGPTTNKELREMVEVPDQEFENIIMKVGDLNESTGKYELRKNFFKELDVWTFDYDSNEDRQKAIDNAVKIYDKMRLSLSEPEWDRLLVRAERGTGKHLSKLQAQIATGPIGKSSIAIDDMYDVYESDEYDDVGLRNSHTLKAIKAMTRRKVSDNVIDVDSAERDQSWQSNSQQNQISHSSASAVPPEDELSPEERAVLEAFRHHVSGAMSFEPSPIISTKSAPGTKTV